jgi:hypothetical protein
VIPWAAILKHAPAMLAAADALMARSRATGTKDKQGTDARLVSLEQRSSESAQLIQDIAQQIQALAAAQEVAARRVRMAMIVAGTAGLLAIGATLLAIFL